MDPDQQFYRIWSAALERYQSESGYQLSPTNVPKNLQDFQRQIDSSQSKFKEYRTSQSRLWSTVASFLGPVETIGEIVAEGAGMVFAPAPMVMGAVSFLIKGAEDVSQCYDYIESLLNDMRSILDRLDIHAKKAIDTKLQAIYSEILACILEIIAVSTKYIKDGRIKRYFKKTFKADDEVESLKEKLVGLVEQETALVGALNLNVTIDLRETTIDVLAQTTTTAATVTIMDTKLDDIGSSVTGIDHKFDNLTTAVQQISLDLKAATTPAGSDRASLLATARTFLEPQTSVEDDLERTTCLPGTGTWVLSEPLVQSWIEGKTPTLFLSGGPGTGKSHLSSLIIKHLRDAKKQDAEAPDVCYFFFKEDNALRRDFKAALKTMAYQLAVTKQNYLSYLDQLFTETTDLCGDIDSLWRKLFFAFFKDTPQMKACMVFDGIDEAKSSELEAFLEPLAKIFSRKEGITNLSILFVGRPDVAWSLEEVFFKQPVPVIDVVGRKNQKDISRFLSSRMKKYRNLVRMKKLHTEIKEKLIDGAGGMFLWVDLMLKELSTKDRESAVKKALDNMPKTLGDLYRRIFNRFSEALADEPEQVEELNELITWVGFSLYPLSVYDLEFLLALRRDDEEAEGSGLYDKIAKRYSSIFGLRGRMHEKNGIELGDAWVNPSNRQEDDSESGERSDENDDSNSDTEGSNKSNDTEGYASSEAYSDDDSDDDDPQENILKGDSEALMRLRDLLTTVHPRHSSFRDFLKTQTSKPTLIGVVAADAKLHILKTCLRILSNPAYMPKSDREWKVQLEEKVSGQAAPSSISFSIYAIQHWVAHLKDIDKAKLEFSEKAEILTSIHRVFASLDITFARFIQGNQRGRPDTQVFTVSGDWADSILAWLKDETVVKACNSEVQDWALKVVEKREELIGSLITKLYQYALQGGTNILRKFGSPLSESWSILRALHTYLLAFYPNAIPDSDCSDTLSLDYDNPSASTVISIFEWPGFDKNALWYGSVACFLSMTENEDEAISYFKKAVDLSKIENNETNNNYMLMCWTYLAQAEIEVEEDEAASTYIKLILETIDNCFGGLEKLPERKSRDSSSDELTQSEPLPPWVFDRETAASLLYWLATHSGSDPTGNFEEQKAYYRKAIRLNIGNDEIIDDVLERALDDERWHETALYALDFMSLAPNSEEPKKRALGRLGRYCSRAMFNKKASTVVHPAFQALGSNSRELLWMWEIGVKCCDLQTRGVPIPREDVDVEYAKILELEGLIGKAIDVLDGVMSRYKTGPQSPKNWVLVETAALLARHLLDEEETGQMRERCQAFMENWYQEFLGVNPSIELFFGLVLGGYSSRQGRETEAADFLRSGVEEAMSLMKESKTLTKASAWERLFWIATAISDEELMKMTLWYSVIHQDPEFSSAQDLDCYENRHGRRWPRRNTDVFMCDRCRRFPVINKPGWPVYFCKFVYPAVLCNRCFEKMEDGDREHVRLYHAKDFWRPFDVEEYPGRKQENVSDEDERKAVLEVFKKKVPEKKASEGSKKLVLRSK